MESYLAVRPLALSNGSLGGPLLAKKRQQPPNSPDRLVIKQVQLSRFGNDRDRIAKAEQEIHRLVGHDFPNFVKVLDHFTASNNLCIVMEFIEHDRNLATIIEDAADSEQPLPEDQIVKWLGQMASALDHFHKLEPPIIHGHLRPENVFVISSAADGDNQAAAGIIKLADIGIARWIYETPKAPHPIGSAVYYSSPEAFQRRPVTLTDKADVWSLGTIGYELANRTPPFKDTVAVALGKAPPVDERYLPDLQHLLRWMVEKKPEDRPTMAQILEEPPIAKDRKSKRLLSPIQDAPPKKKKDKDKKDKKKDDDNDNDDKKKETKTKDDKKKKKNSRSSLDESSESESSSSSSSSDEASSSSSPSPSPPPSKTKLPPISPASPPPPSHKTAHPSSSEPIEPIKEPESAPANEPPSQSEPAPPSPKPSLAKFEKPPILPPIPHSATSKPLSAPIHGEPQKPPLAVARASAEPQVSLQRTPPSSTAVKTPAPTPHKKASSKSRSQDAESQHLSPLDFSVEPEATTAKTPPAPAIAPEIQKQKPSENKPNSSKPLFTEEEKLKLWRDVQNGNLKAVKDCLSEDKDNTARYLDERSTAVDERFNHDGYTLLHVASQYGRTEVVGALVELGAKVDSRTKSSYHTPLMVAAIYDQKEVAALLVTKFHADVWARAGIKDACFTALHFAVKNGKTNVAVFLANFNPGLLEATDNVGDLPIHVAVRTENRETALALVKLAGAQLEATGYATHTPLHAACLVGDLVTIRELVKAGAKLDAKSLGDNGNTPLIAAALADKIEVVRVLVELKASLNDTDGDNNSVLHVVVGRCKLEVLTYLLQLKQINLEVKGFSGRTPLHTAAERGQLEAAKLLVKRGAKVSARSGAKDHSATPLLLACFYGHPDVADILIKSKASVDERDINQNRALHLAAIGGHVACAKVLLAAGAAVNAPGFHGRTALHQAAWKNQVEVAKVLLNHRSKEPSIDVTSGIEDDLFTPLEMAIFYGSEDVVRLLVARGASKIPKYLGDGPLHIAAKAGHSEIMRFLVEQRFPLESKGFLERTPLLTAAVHGQTKTAKILLEHGAVANVKSNTQDAHRTALHLAAGSESKDLIELLVAWNADVNAVDANGDTPLHIGALAGKVETCKSLIKHGADINAKGFSGKTPLHHVVCYGEKFEQQRIMVEALLDQQAFIDAKSGDAAELTPLAASTYTGKTDIAKLLVEKGASQELPDANGDMAIHVACRNGNSDIVSFLLATNSEYSTLTGKNGRTPLHTAVKAQQVETVRVLLRYNVDVDAKSSLQDFERTPLHFTALQGNQIITELLIKAGADVSEKDYNENAAIHLAVMAGHRNVVTLLAKSQPDVLESSGKRGLRPLHYAAKANLVDMVELLLNLRADSEARCGIDDDQAIHCAAAAGSVEAINLLLKKNPRLISTKNKKGETPIHKAIARSNVEAVKYLYKFGARVDIPDQRNQTAYELAHYLARNHPTKASTEIALSLELSHLNK